MKKRITKQNILLCLFVIGLLSAGYWGLRYCMEPPTFCTDPPAKDFSISAAQTHYPIGTDAITISVTNNGNYSGEINKPYLERKWNDGWHVVSVSSVVSDTSELLSTAPGATRECVIPLAAYQSNLKPGEYRSVFTFVEDDDYFAFPFYLTEP